MTTNRVQHIEFQHIVTMAFSWGSPNADLVIDWHERRWADGLTAVVR
jgi:hypothetical protein